MYKLQKYVGGPWALVRHYSADRIVSSFADDVSAGNEKRKQNTPQNGRARIGGH
jgi:hypothetical protein